MSDYELIRRVSDKLAPWDEPSCGLSDKSMGWPKPTGGCRFCDYRIADAEENWMDQFSRPMIVCTICGNKRCPHAAWHRNNCTGSNASNQPTPYPELPSLDDVKELLAALRSKPVN
jgi:hypothetical protein